MKLHLILLLALSWLGGCAANAPVAPEDFTDVIALSEEFSHAAKRNQVTRLAKTPPVARKTAAPFTCNVDKAGIDLSRVNKVDLSFIDADIREALLEISMLTEVPIVADETVQGLLTATVLGKDIESALNIILAPGNFTYKKFRDYIYVGSQFPGSPSLALLSDTCRFRPRHLEAAKLVNLLADYQQRFINLNEENNLISIVAPPAYQKEIQNNLLLLDQPREQVLLEVSIVEVSREVFDILGIHWGNLNLVEEGIELAMVNQLLDRGGSQNNYNVIGGNPVNTVTLKRFKDSIGVLKNHGDVDIKAMPSIVTLDGKGANFNSTETLWMPGGLDGSSSKSRGVEYGVNVKIVPHIAGHGDIRLDIQDASVSDLTLAAGGEPLLVSHSVSNFVQVAHGDVVVLGGLLQKKRRESEAHMPGAASIPGLKRLFAQKRNEIKETEVLIVIKPTILG
jgi:type II secretory pathway component GspD/PulD (secretin)